MMKGLLVFSYCLLTIFACSCSGGVNDRNTSEEKTDTLSGNNQVIFATCLEIEPVIAEADSAQLIYYDNPLGDSLRYNRYFTYLAMSDSSFLNGLKSIFRQVPQILPEVRNCRSEGKIYLFSHTEPVKTIFFSSLSDDCRYLYFIKDGKFYYVNQYPAFEAKIKELRKLANEP